MYPMPAFEAKKAGSEPEEVRRKYYIRILFSGSCPNF
jgi:hypothetical protein